MKFACDRCGCHYAVADDLRGRAFKMRCKACGHLIVVKPAADGSEPSGFDAAPGGVSPFLADPLPAPSGTQPLPAQARADVEPGRLGAGSPTAPPPGGRWDLILDTDEQAWRALQPPLGGALRDLDTPPVPAPRWAEAGRAVPGATPFPPEPSRFPDRDAGPGVARTGSRGGQPSPAAPPPRPAASRASGAALVALFVLAVAAVGAGVLLDLRADSSASALLAGPSRAHTSRVGDAQPPRPPPGRQRGLRARGESARAAVARGEAEGPAGAPLASSALVSRAVAANRGAFESCIDEAMRRDPDLARDGRQVVLDVIVNPAGAVTSAALDDAELASTDLGSCLAAAAGRMEFAAHPGRPFHVEVPLTLGRARP